jgi:hypothetical protein
VSYHLVAIGERRILALPSVDARHVRLAYRGLSNNTPKKTAFRLAYRAASAIGRAAWYMQSVPSPLLGDDGSLWEKILAFVGRSANRKIDPHIVYFPGQQHRKRVYLYVPSLDGRDGLYAKIEYGPSSKALENELQFLHSLSGLRRPFSVPHCVGHVFENEFRVLLLREFPHGFAQRALRWNSRPSSLRNQIIGLIRPKDICELTWWREFQRLTQDEQPKLPELFLAHIDAYHPVGVAHGDFTTSNIFYSGEKTLILDWEAASVEAPFLLDEFSYCLELRQRQVYKTPARSFIDICKTVVDECHRTLGKQRVDSALLSIAYLMSKGSQEAKVIGARLTDESLRAAYGLSRPI